MSLRRYILILIISTNLMAPLPAPQASELILPQPGSMLTPTKAYNSVSVKGLTIDPKNPLRFSFIVEPGDTGLSGLQLKDESLKLIKYFLSALTIPEDEMWVNLSPYEKNRIITDQFGSTQMGRDLLAQDYILKQLSASLIYPEHALGKAFWQKVYSQVKDQFRTTQMPVNMFNKIWIVPDQASIYEHQNSAFIVNSRLKVLMEQDYLATQKNDQVISKEPQDRGLSQIIRDNIVPAIEKEVNEGAHFANLRQIYQAMILAVWYKIRLKDSLLGKTYVNLHKVKGVALANTKDNDMIYQNYLRAFKKGVFNYIKEEENLANHEMVSRKYFSGGFMPAQLAPIVKQGLVFNLPDRAILSPEAQTVTWEAEALTSDQGMTGELQQSLKMSDQDFQVLLGRLAKDKYITANSEVDLEFKGLKPAYARLYPAHHDRISKLLSDGRLKRLEKMEQDRRASIKQELGDWTEKVNAAVKRNQQTEATKREALVQKWTPTFKRYGIYYFYLFKYMSERIFHMPFRYELEDFLQESVVACHGVAELGKTDDISFIIAAQRHFLQFFAEEDRIPYKTKVGVVTKLRALIENYSASKLQVVPNRYLVPALRAEFPKLQRYVRPNDPLEGEVEAGHFGLIPLEETSRELYLQAALPRVLDQTKKANRLVALQFGLGDDIEKSNAWIAKELGYQFENSVRSRSYEIRVTLSKNKALRDLTVYDHQWVLFNDTLDFLRYQERAAQSSSPKKIPHEPALNFEDERRLMDLVHLWFAASQLRFLRALYLGDNTDSFNEGVQREAKRRINLFLTLGVLSEFGLGEQLIPTIVRLSAETPLQRMFRHAGVEQLLRISNGDINAVVEFVMQMFPEVYKEEDVRRLARGYFDLPKIPQSPHVAPQQVLRIVHNVISKMEGGESRRRYLVKRRLVRDLYYHSIVNNTSQALEGLNAAIGEAGSDQEWQNLLKDTYDYYQQATAFYPRGFQEETEVGQEPMLPAQRFGIWEAVLSLSNPRLESAVHMSEARIGKTIMAILSVFNVRKPNSNDYAVRKVLYTTTNSAKYEVYNELVRRTNKELDLHVIVVDRQNGNREQQVEEAIKLAEDPTKNVVLIANYDAVRLSPEAFSKFAPDAHIVDEVESLKSGDAKRTPIIFGIPAKYRVAVSARAVVNRSEDVHELILWTQHREFLPWGRKKEDALQELKDMSQDRVFEVLSRNQSRWRRSTVMPEVKEPVFTNEPIEYSLEQQQSILKISSVDEFEDWQLNEAREDKGDMNDSVLTRIDLLRRASIELGLVQKEAYFGQYMDASPKIQRLDAIIDNEFKSQGKVYVEADFPEAIDRLVARYAQKYGPRAAAGIHGQTLVKDRVDIIRRFRSDPELKILIGTPHTTASSLNLSQLRGSSFHNSLLVRLDLPARNVDDGDRLIDPWQDKQVRVISLIGVFRKDDLAKYKRSIDEQFFDLRSEKQRVFEHVIDGKPLVSDEETEEIKDMVEEFMEPSEIDAAMMEKGGIDLNSKSLKLHMNGDQPAASFRGTFLPAFDGLYPVLVDIQPANTGSKYPPGLFEKH